MLVFLGVSAMMTVGFGSVLLIGMGILRSFAYLVPKIPDQLSGAAVFVVLPLLFLSSTGCGLLFIATQITPPQPGYLIILGLLGYLAERVRRRRQAQRVEWDDEIPRWW